MPYASKVTPERSPWYKLREAAAHVARVDNCDTKQAQQQLRSALADGELWPLRWENPPFMASLVGSYPDLPPKGGAHWKKVRIRWSREQQVLDDFWQQQPGTVGVDYTPEWRVLLIDRTALSKLWPESEPKRAHAIVADIGAARRRRGRPPRERNATEAVMRDELQRQLLTREELRDMGEEALAARYKVNRATAVAARIIVLSENVGNSG